MQEKFQIQGTKRLPCLTSTKRTCSNRRTWGSLYVGRRTRQGRAQSNTKSLSEAVEAAFEATRRDRARDGRHSPEAVEDALDLLRRRRGAGGGKSGRRQVRVNQWLEKAVLLSSPERHERGSRADRAVPSGGTRSRPNSMLGTKRIFALSDFARCLAALYGVLPISHPASC